MKKIGLILIIILLLFTGCREQNDLYVPGSYVGEAEGYTSTLKVKVTVDEKQIKDIEILENNEPKVLADIVMATIPKKVIKKNSTDVDIVAGATYTSKNLLRAIDNALAQASNSEEITGESN